MDCLKILTLILLIPSFAVADSLAQRTCEQQYRDLLQNCQSFAFDDGERVNLDMDRHQAEADQQARDPFAGEQVSFSGDRCTGSEDYFRLTLIFKQRNSEGEPQCAIWRHFRDGAGQAAVEETVYRGDNRTHLSRMEQQAFYDSPVNRDLTLDRPGQNSFLNRLGRAVTPLFNRIGIGSRPEQVYPEQTVYPGRGQQVAN